MKRPGRGRRLAGYGVLALGLCLAGCAPGEGMVETDTLITHAEVYNELGENVSSSDFAYNTRCLLIAETHRAGERLTKFSFTYDDKDRLAVRIDEWQGSPPVREDYTYADDGSAVNIRQSSEGEPDRDMNNIYLNGVLIERNWGKSRPNVVLYKLETIGNTIIRRTYLAGGALRSTETLTFADGLLASIEYRGRDSNETRRYEYDGRKLVKESVFDDRGNKTSEIKYAYSPVNVLKSRAGTYNYLHVANLIAEVKGNRTQ